MLKKVLLFILVSLVTSTVFGQTEKRLLMLGGQVLEGLQLDENIEEIVFETTKKNGKIKIVIVDKSRIFSSTENGIETVHYNPDSSETGYSINEMRYYIKGQQDGRVLQKTTATWIVSVAVSGALATYAGSEGSAAVVIAPIPGAIFGSLSSRNVPPNEHATGTEPSNKAAYITGYKQSARMKKIVHSILGSVIGTVVGGAIGFQMNGNS